MELLVMLFLDALAILGIYFLLKVSNNLSDKIKAHKARPGPIGLIIQLSAISVPVILVTAVVYVLFLA